MLRLNHGCTGPLGQIPRDVPVYTCAKEIRSNCYVTAGVRPFPPSGKPAKNQVTFSYTDSFQSLRETCRTHTGFREPTKCESPSFLRRDGVTEEARGEALQTHTKPHCPKKASKHSRGGRERRVASLCFLTAILKQQTQGKCSYRYDSSWQHIQAQNLTTELVLVVGIHAGSTPSLRLHIVPFLPSQTLPRHRLFTHPRVLFASFALSQIRSSLSLLLPSPCRLLVLSP